MLMYRCENCKHDAPKHEFTKGKGREYGQHPEHRYCPKCAESIDWYGYKVINIIEKELKLA